jgi:chromate transport protein ChrA
VVVLLLAVAPVMALLLLAVARRAAARWGPVVALLLLAMAPVVALLLLAVACRGAPAAGCGPRRGTAAPRCGFCSCCCSLWPVMLLLIPAACAFVPGRIVFHSLLIFVDATPPPQPSALRRVIDDGSRCDVALQ